MNNKLKSERGSVTIFILASCLFFLMSTIGVQGYIKNKQSALEKDYRQVKESYEKDIDNQEKIYNKLKDVSKSGNITVSFEIQDGYLIPTGANSVNILQKFTIDNGTNKEIRQISYGWSNSTSSEPEEWTSLPTNNLTCLVSKDDAVVGDYYLWVKVVDEDAHEETVHMQNAITVYNQEIIIDYDGEDAVIIYPSQVTMYNKKVGQGEFESSAEENKVNNSNSNIEILSNYIYAEATDSHGNKVLKNINRALIDNSGSLVWGFVDDLGTRSTIYLYGNTNQITSGTINITMPDSTTKNITALSSNSSITSTSNYATYTVTENGTYTFSVTGGSKTTNTKIKVKNIEKFTAIETLAIEQNLTYAGGQTKAYNYKGAAVPKGYYVDKNSDVSTGLVITDSIDSKGYSTGNEWIWVPLTEDPSYNYYVTLETAESMDGASSVMYTNYSKLWKFTTDKSKNTNKTTFANLAFTQAKPSNSLGNREPALVYTSIGNLYDYSNYTNVYNRNASPMTTFNSSAAASNPNTVTDLATQFKEDYDNMLTSVNTYGGFYIGRYEITENGEKPGTSLSNKTWYELYNKCMYLNKGTNTETSMIYGTLWDVTMKWLGDQNYNVGSSGETTSEYGNYNKEAVKVYGKEKNKTTGDYEVKTTITIKPGSTSTKLETGQTSYTRSNNIYDLSGNCCDWTQEASDANQRVMRGGNYSNILSTNTYSADRDDDLPTSKDVKVSSRAQLYIK